MRTTLMTTVVLIDHLCLASTISSHNGQPVSRYILLKIGRSTKEGRGSGKKKIVSYPKRGVYHANDARTHAS